MTNNDARTSKLARSLAIAQASILMLGLVFMSVPMPAHATTIGDWDDGFDHQNHSLNIVKVIDGGDAEFEDFSVTVTKHFFFTPWITSSSNYTFDANGEINIDPQVLYRYSVVENDPGSDYTPSYDNCSDIHNDTCTITNTFNGPSEPQTCSFYSDETTMVGDVGAVHTFEHLSWIDNLANLSAKWIWNAPFATPSDSVDEVVTFTKTFNVVGTPSSVVLNLAADNYYTVQVNAATDVCADTSNLDNFSAQEAPCDITSYVNTGINTLTFTVTNKSGFGTIPQENPAGLIYSVDIVGASCAPVPPTPDQPGTLTIIKEVVNAPEGVGPEDFQIYVKTAVEPSNVLNSPHAGVGGSGYSYQLAPGAYVVSEDPNPSYTTTFSESCSDGTVDVAANQEIGCVVTNTYVPPAPTCDSEVNLLSNGDFENPDVATGGWNLFPTGTLGLGWTVNWFNPAGEVPAALLEIQDTLSGWTPFGTGSQWAELDSDWSTSDTGHPAATWITQTVATVPGQTYTFTFDSSPRPGTVAGENAVEATVDGVALAPAVAGVVGGGNTAWTGHSYSFVATGASTVVGLRDAGTPSDSLGALVDNASLRCTAPVPTNTATIHAQKVICNSEAALPNMSGSESNITATTAAEWVAQSNGACHLADWDFQWAPNGATNPGDNVTGLPEGWTSFIGGVASVPAGALVWVRENIDTAYIPFSGAETNSPVSAEMYCNTDVLNYDNLDYVDPVVAGQHYYCVAFNAPVAEVPQDSHGPVQIETGRSGGGDSNSSSNSSSDGNGDVLGESTATCEALLTDYLKIGWANNPDQVKKLQGFLAEHLGNGLPVTGFFGPLTFGAVKVFQSEDWEDVLKPWISVPGSGITGQNTPTGFVYKTTKWHINNIVCPGSEEFPANLD